MRRILMLANLLVLIQVLDAVGQTSPNSLTWKNATAFNAFLLRSVHQQYGERKILFEQALASASSLNSYRERLKEKYEVLIGALPTRGPLHSRTVQVSRQDGYRIEKILFESFPRHHVTANLYLPEGNGPFPVTLSLAGHGMNGKAGDQTLGRLLALNGIAVLAVDPAGQGERVQLLDTSGRPSTRGATTEHTLLNAGCNLVGSSLAAYELFDNSRAIDYIETRRDLDKDRIGCIGSSGGGTQTSYLIAFDTRIKVGVVCSYFSSRERTLELMGPSDGCQHMPGEGAAGFEISDFLTLFSPKPLLIMSGLYDFVDYWGALQGFTELKRVYHAEKAEDRLSMFTIEGGHGMPQAKREAAASWFSRWLLSKDVQVKEKQSPAVSDQDILVTNKGQVLLSLPAEESIPAYNAALFQKMSASRSAFLASGSEVVRSRVLRMIGLDTAREPVTTEKTGRVQDTAYTMEKFQLIRKGEMPVPLNVFYPQGGYVSGNLTICLHGAGKDKLIQDQAVIARYMERGDILILCDLRGFGETQDPPELNDSKYCTREYRNAMISLHLGRPLVGQRVADIQTVLDFIDGESSLRGKHIQLLADGLYGPAAIHAAFLDKRIGSAEIRHSLKSFADLIRDPLQHEAFSNVIPGVVQWYDLDDLVKLAGAGRIRFID